jgi:hypothetical protein
MALACSAALLPSASAAGILPPHNPARNCDARPVNALTVTIRSVDRCRARENVGRLKLPTNYHRLTVPQQMLVVVDLERVNRGLAPIVGLSRTLDSLAQQGANSETDPSFPGGGYDAAGSVWAYGWNIMGADVGWMYDDGWGRSGENLDCTSAHSSGCWAHRDIILMRGHRDLVAGGGATTIASGQLGVPPAHSYAFEILGGYSTRHLTFTWSHELRYFKVKPSVEPLKN